MEVGQNVYIHNRRNWYAGTIIKITVTGLIDVQVATIANDVYRFNKDGWQRGAVYDGWHIDNEMPFAQRTFWVGNRDQCRRIARKIADIQGKHLYSSFGDDVPEKKALQDEVNRLQNLLDNAVNMLTEVK